MADSLASDVKMATGRLGCFLLMACQASPTALLSNPTCIHVQNH